MEKFSQYPHEVEVTWPPLTALSFVSKEVQGSVVVLKVQPTICQKDGRRREAMPPNVLDLATGVAKWRCGQESGGLEVASLAAVGTGRLANDAKKPWHRAKAEERTQAKWLGSASDEWPVGDTLFEVSFEVERPEAARLELPYAADGAVVRAALNGKPVDFGAPPPAPHQAYEKGALRTSIVTATRAEQFRKGTNTLRLTVRTGGAEGSLAPMGLYAEGGVTFAERTPEAAEQVRPARLPTNPHFPGEIQPAKRVWESDAFGSKTHLSNAETHMDDRGGGLFVFMEKQKPPCVERPSSAARRQASRANSLAQQQQHQQQQHQQQHQQHQQHQHQQYAYACVVFRVMERRDHSP